jgi:mono/diheme cytochrome c family protein
VRDRIAIGATICHLVFLASGCARQPEPVFSSSAQVQKLKPEFQQQIRRILADQCGRPLAPRLLGNKDVSEAHLKRGAEVYSRYCVQCHGVTGDGNGAAATYLIPRPRNYLPGIFKFTSTTYGSKPLKEDLLRTVRRGIRGTSMPAFYLLPPNDLDAVVEYVLALTRRGELESKLADQAEFEEQVDERQVPQLAEQVLGPWRIARSKVVYPSAPMPEFKRSNIDEGKAAFLSIGCSKCHGDDGRGMMASNVGTDAWGNPTKAADLTSGMLRGGTEPLDIYRHIDAGINGTPMPSFHETLKEKPETAWNLVAYVLRVADSRRSGAMPDAGLLEDGLLKPLPGVNPGSAAPAPTTTRERRGDQDVLAATDSVGR